MARVTSCFNTNNLLATDNGNGGLAPPPHKTTHSDYVYVLVMKTMA